MILDAVLLALAEIASTQKRGVAILPEMRIGQGDGVQISHPISAALSVKYTSLARDIEDDKTPNLSIQRIFARLY
jgi:hypothetical protein